MTQPLKTAHFEEVKGQLRTVGDEEGKSGDFLTESTVWRVGSGSVGMIQNRSVE